MIFERIKEYSQIHSAFEELKDSFYTVPSKYEELIEKIYKNGIVIAAKSGSINGLIAFYANDYTSKTAYITSVLVSLNSRGKGLGTALMKECEKICREKCFERIRLEVNSENGIAVSLYKKLGYMYSEINQKSVYMEKIL